MSGFITPADMAFAQSALDLDHSSADRFDPLRVGKLGVYFRRGFRRHFIPFNALEAVVLREQTLLNVPRCGRAIHSYHHLVFVLGEKETGDLISEDRKLFEAAAELIKERACHIELRKELK